MRNESEDQRKVAGAFNNPLLAASAHLGGIELFAFRDNVV